MLGTLLSESNEVEPRLSAKSISPFFSAATIVSSLVKMRNTSSLIFGAPAQ